MFPEISISVRKKNRTKGKNATRAVKTTFGKSPSGVLRKICDFRATSSSRRFYLSVKRKIDGKRTGAPRGIITRVARLPVAPVHSHAGALHAHVARARGPTSARWSSLRDANKDLFKPVPNCNIGRPRDRFEILATANSIISARALFFVFSSFSALSSRSFYRLRVLSRAILSHPDA